MWAVGGPVGARRTRKRRGEGRELGATMSPRVEFSSRDQNQLAIQKNSSERPESDGGSSFESRRRLNLSFVGAEAGVEEAPPRQRKTKITTRKSRKTRRKGSNSAREIV